MTRAALGRAELLHILAHLPEAEWAAAAQAVGYAPLPAKLKTTPARIVTTAKPAEVKVTPPADEPYRPGALPDLPFWRIASSRQLRPEERPGSLLDWLQEGPVWEEPGESDPAIAQPVSRPLTPRAMPASCAGNWFAPALGTTSTSPASPRFSPNAACRRACPN